MYVCVYLYSTYVHTIIPFYSCSYNLDCQNAMRSIYAEITKELFDIHPRLHY